MGGFVEGLNLEPLYELIESREGESWPAAGPEPCRLFFAVCGCMRSLEGVGSAAWSWPRLWRGATRPIRWLCGGGSGGNQSRSGGLPRLLMGEFLDGGLFEREHCRPWWSRGPWWIFDEVTCGTGPR